MSNRVYLTSTEVLVALRSAFTSFDESARNALASIDSEIEETRTWLLERKRYWQRAVAEAEQELAIAEDNLRTCEASGYYDDDGDYAEPDCSSEADAVADAQNTLSDASAKLDNVVQWEQRVELGAQEFHRTASQFASAGTHRAQERQRFLDLKIKQYGDAIAQVPTAIDLLSTRRNVETQASRALQEHVFRTATLVNPAKLATLGARGCNPRIQKLAYWLEQGRRSGHSIDTILDQALSPYGFISHEAVNVTKRALLRNHTIAERLGCFTSDGLAAMRRGQSPTIQRGPYKGDRLSVDHIIPLGICPELENVISNLEFMPLSMNISKSAMVGPRQMQLATHLNKATLLSDQGLKAVAASHSVAPPPATELCNT